MATSARIHWVRILFGGFLAELSVIAIVIPISKLFGQHSLHYAAPPASMLACFLFAIWVGRHVESHFLLQGTLVGVVATLIYIGLTRGQPEPLAYIVAHALKILGGAAGGLVASRQKNSMAAQGRQQNVS